jgi:tetratricopeptide (TPR) repeat protein
MKPLLCFFLLLSLSINALGQQGSKLSEPTDAAGYVTLFNRAVEFYKTGNPERAIEAFWLTLKYNPNDFEAYFYLAQAYRQVNRKDEEIASYQKAIIEYRRAIKLNPQNALLQSGLCSALLEVGRYWESNEPCRQAIRLEPKDPAHYLKFGMFHEGLSNYEGAAQAYQLAIALQPNFVEARRRLALAYYRLGSFSEAVAALKVTAQLEPTNERVQRDIAEISVYLRQLSESDIINTNDGRSLHNLAGALRLLDYNLEAVVLYKRALQRQPNNAQLHCDLGLTYYILGQYREAIKEYARAVAIEPGSLEARNKLNWINQYLGRKHTPTELSRKSHR